MSFITKLKVFVAIIFVFILYNYFFHHHTKNNIIKFYRNQLNKDENIMNEIISFMKQKDSTCSLLILDYVGHNKEPLFFTCTQTHSHIQANSPDEINDYVHNHRSVVRIAGITIFDGKLIDYQLNPYFLAYLENLSQIDSLKKLKPHWTITGKLNNNWFVIKGKNRLHTDG